MKQQNKVVLGLVLGAVVIVCLGVILIMGKSPSKKQNDKQMNKSFITITQAVKSQAEGEKLSFTFEEIAMHATPTDCWFAVEDKVYNVTKYIESNKHPGGSIILQGCGKDATELFNTKAGKGEMHSDEARNFLEDYYIGELE